MATENEKIVADFCDTWRRMNVDEMLGYMADDAVYHNIPMEPLKGRSEIRKGLHQFAGMLKAVEIRIVNSAAVGNLVITERIDTMVTGDGQRTDLPVAGVFELRDGKISAWRDYFDLKMAGMG
ncbi:MAG TPA: limonene-1,2-epoxide hydrolase family protein [Candidatus Binataceae bacterium]